MSEDTQETSEDKKAKAMEATQAFGMGLIEAVAKNQRGETPYNIAEEEVKGVF